MLRFFVILLLCTSAAWRAEAAPSPWPQLTVADVERLRRSVIDFHPGMRDPDTPDFAARVATAYQTAKARAQAAKSYADWLSATQGFMLSFRDGHTIFRPNLSPTRVRWPGFLIYGRANGWVVRRPTGFVDDGAGPAEGVKITACDGIPIDKLLKARLDGIEADWSKEPERIRQAYRLLLDPRIEGAPPLTDCTFEWQGQVTTQKLAWQIAPWSSLSSGLAPYLRRVVRPISLRTLASGGRWISLGSFGDEAKLEALAKSIESAPGELATAPFVVFDLRGNAGGNSTWGERFARIVWGEAAVASRTAEIDARPGVRAGKYFRATPEVARAARAAAAEFKAQGPNYASVARYWYEIADRIAASPDGDRKLVHDPCCDRTPSDKPVTAVPNTHDKPVFVLIDAGCFSSCVLAANRLIEQGAIAIGETSGQNEEYGEIVSLPPLPSGLARYYLPISIIRQPSETLRIVPKVRWEGAMDADGELETWIAKMARNSTP